MQLLTVHIGTARGIIHLQLSICEYRIRVRHTACLYRSQAPLRDAQPGKQLLNGERFGQIVVSARVQSFYFIGVLAAGADHDNWKIGPGPDLAYNLDAVHIRQPQVQQDDFGIV